MPRTYGKRKQQTRLAFAPVPEDSVPNAANSSSSPRPAKLRYSDPSSASRRIFARGQLQLEDYTERPWGNFQRTPGNEVSENDETSIREKKKKKKEGKRKKVSTSPSPHPESEIHTEATALIPDEGIFHPSKRRRKSKLTVVDSESDKQNQSSNSTSQSQELQDSSYREVAMKKSKKAKSSKSLLQRGQNEAEGSTDSASYYAPKTRSVLNEKRRLSNPTSPPRKKSLAVDLTGLGEAETSDSEDLVIIPSSSRKRKMATKQQQDPFIFDDNDGDSESDVIPSSRKRKTSKTKLIHEESPTQIIDLDDSSDDVVTSTPARRGLRKSPHTPSNRHKEIYETPTSSRARQDELDIQEDLEDLMDTAVKRNRTRGAVVNSARSKRQMHLDLLRRRRAGEKNLTDATNSASEEDDDDSEGASDDSSQHSDNGSEIAVFGVNNDDETDDSDANSEVSSIEDLDKDDASFVEEDDTMGVPVDMPFEFSRHRVKQPRECFRDVVEWMVHNKLNPAFARHDDIYQFAFKKLSDEVVGRTGSQLISSVWTPEFVNVLCARPYIDVSGFPTSEDVKCAACNRTKHPASSDVKFFGLPYSEDTLEPLYDSDDDSEDDDEEEEGGQVSDKRARDRNIDREGNVLPPEDRHFYLGRHCKANAVLTHTLLHWRFHLYEWVVDYLDAKEGLSDPQRSVERDKLSMKKRAKYANKVVDAMDTDGEIQRLWRDFHHNLKAAREKNGGLATNLRL
ncbi:hypothetical protein BGW36DRAFT_404351 [Talaromyces proteolyticus]|uniref:DUF4211 domain-containing protein n=1 Tax=Talaromyces proteolyticus TaxID=1131652 RepID=A0AAD4Q0H8_9EURO|nr:uncharacterized protein BGW36DRAFT_404351 [Talaromyces proteolyticus]KAH8704118.1 hypothetical protein BGW36DRAFT_404351 [Talaromyces proteolyticus]